MHKIFIVDDHAPVIRVMRLGLEAAGYEVITAGNGAECLTKLLQDTPDFLVTDIDMPRMNGRELCMAIQQQFPDHRYPIVVLTSRTELEHRDWTSEIDNLLFMEKPVSIQKLLKLIADMLPPETAPAEAG